MRSNIIQMLLNASSGKGGSSPGQPSSEWTIVHLLMVNQSSQKSMRGVTFKDKSGKYYYVRSAYDVTQKVPGHDTNYGAYGFADLLPWQGATTAVTSLGSKETIDLETKDSNGRPKAICLINSLYYSNGLPRHIFNTDASNSFWSGLQHLIVTTHIPYRVGLRMLFTQTLQLQFKFLLNKLYQ